MTASELLARIRADGGQVWIDSAGRFKWRKVPRKLGTQLARDSFLVKCVLREERATRAWEASGRDPKWYQSYRPDDPVVIPCGEPNCKLEPGEDVWTVIKTLTAEEQKKPPRRAVYAIYRWQGVQHQGGCTEFVDTVAGRLCAACYPHAAPG